MKKLSELENDVMLVVGDKAMTKEEFFDSSEYFDIFPDDKETYPKVFIGDETVAIFDFESIIENESEYMSEDWDEIIKNKFTSDELSKIEEVEAIINKVFKATPSYYEGEPVEIDVFSETSTNNSQDYNFEVGV